MVCPAFLVNVTYDVDQLPPTPHLAKQEQQRSCALPHRSEFPAMDDLRTVAARHVDGDFRRVHDDLIQEHRQQEQRILAWDKAALESHARNRELAGLRYVQRLRTIEEKRDRIADRIQARHNSVGGRLAALTKKGRERQAAELERLNDRAHQLQAKAHRNYQALTERQFQNEQRDRMLTATHIKFYRQENYDHRQEQLKLHQATREQKIDAKVQQIRRETAERLLRHEMQRTRTQAEQVHSRAR
jgi:uncharacterized protein YbjQ (UPF0145 family)